MKKVYVFLAIVATALFGGIAFGSIPGSNGVISGCYKSSGGGPPAAQGVIRVIDAEASESCLSGETALNWNQTGPQGPQGQTGATGSQGSAGIDGQDGVSGYEVVTSSTVNLGPGEEEFVSVVCSSSKKVLGGGFERLFGNLGFFNISLNAPAPTEDA